MGILSDLSLDKLRGLAVGAIRAGVIQKINSLTKKQLIILILKVPDVDVDNLEMAEETGKDGPNGQISRLRLIKDVLGNKLRSTNFGWSYYPGNEVDIIATTELDQADQVLSTKKLKHYTDGRQPEIIP